VIDFDNAPSREGTWAVKYQRYAGTGILPMWVADMDFACPEQVREEFERRIEHPIYGYTLANELSELLVERMLALYGWLVRPEWIVYSAGLISGINCACKAVCAGAGGVAVNTPIYPPFLHVPPFNNCPLVKNPLINESGGFRLDFTGMREKLSGEAKMLLFCNPHNPTGRCFTRDELEETAKIVIKTDSVICSDEIHCELTLGENRHIPIASLSGDIASRSITLMSPSKTFGIAGLMIGFAIIPDESLRRRYSYAKEQLASHPNIFGIRAAKAVYSSCEPWRRELLAYLTESRDLITSELKDTGILCSPPEATYLYWLDCRPLGLDNPSEHFERYGVGLNNGADFDAPGFLRLNFATPRPTLREALKRMKKAIDSIQQT
jgi:cystathionine beta-lyase